MYKGFTQCLVPAGSPDTHQFPFFVMEYITETLITHFYILETPTTLSLRCSWYVAGRIWLGGDTPEMDGQGKARRDSCQPAVLQGPFFLILFPTYLIPSCPC